MKKSVCAAALMTALVATAANENLNRLPARVPVVPCESEELAIAIANGDKRPEASRWVIDLGKWGRDPAKHVYTASFERPWRWWFRRTVIRFSGVEGAFSLKVNGREVGSAADDGLRAEFDLTDYLNIFFANDIELAFDGEADRIGSVVFVSESGSGPKDFVLEMRLSEDRKTGGFTLKDEKGGVIKERTVPEPRFWTTEKPFIYLTPFEHKWGWWFLGGTDHYGAFFCFRDDRVADIRGASAAGLELKTGDILRLKAHNVNVVKDVKPPFAAGLLEACSREGIAIVTETKPAGVYPCVFTSVEGGRWLTNLREIRDESESAKAAAHSYQTMNFTGFDWQKGEVTAVSSNRVADFNEADGFVIAWQGDKKLYKRMIDIEDFAPGSERKIKVDIDNRGKGADRVRFEVIRDGSVIAWEEFRK